MAESGRWVRLFNRKTLKEEYKFVTNNELIEIRYGKLQEVYAVLSS